jgi:hypothetical protein
VTNVNTQEESIMTDSIDPFPQHRAGKPKPTIVDIVMDRAKPGMPAAAMMDAIVPTVRAHYPDMTPEQIDAAIRAEVVAWDTQLGGSEFWDDFDDAVALDPDWYETENHSTCCRPGALHDTPQKLVAAYRAWHDKDLPVEELVDVLTQRAIDASDINRRTFDPDRPGAVEPIRVAMMQIISAHPRGEELLAYADEQARRAGKLGKAKRG